ncbi:MAG: hypothetical protein KGJ02_02160, partial [Verrucomicrobiota bacterium]|nr:hypothetical protein [Verrucomicrobiota bacterium]
MNLLSQLFRVLLLFTIPAMAVPFPIDLPAPPLPPIHSLTYEAVAKLLCPGKSMILRPFASGGKATTVHLTRSAPSGPTEENGRKWPQKGG